MCSVDMPMNENLKAVVDDELRFLKNNFYFYGSKKILIFKLSIKLNCVKCLGKVTSLTNMGKVVVI